MTGVTQLPDELIVSISRFLSTASLAAFGRTCHRAHRIAHPILYSDPQEAERAFLWAAKNGRQQTIKHALEFSPLDLTTNQSLADAAMTSACTGGNTNTVRLFLNMNIRPDPPNRIYNNSNLRVAANNGHAEVIALLISAGANINQFLGTIHQSPLSHAGADGNLGRVAETFIQRGIDINRNDGIAGSTYLHYATTLDCPSPEIAVSRLLELGANVNAQDDLGGTALSFACLRGHTEAVRTLLHHGAQVNLPDITGRQPLHVAIDRRRSEIVDLLLEYKADVHARAEGKTPVELVRSSWLGREDEVAHHILAALIRAGGFPGPEKGEEILGNLLWQADVGHVQLLLDAYIASLPSGSLPHTLSPVLLSAAVKVGNIALLRRIVDEYGAEPVIALAFTRDEPNSPIPAGLQKKQYNAVAFLVGLLPETDNWNEYIPAWILGEAAKTGADPILRLLFPRISLTDTEALNILIQAISSQCIDTLSLVLEDVNPAILHTLHEKHRTPLQHAMTVENYRAALLLIERAGIPPSCKRGGCGSLLWAACKKNEVGLARALIRAGAPVNARSPLGYTGLMMAAHFASVDMVAMLMEEGGDIEAGIREGENTALALAVMVRDPGKVAVLLKGGARCTVRVNSFSSADSGRDSWEDRLAELEAEDEGVMVPPVEEQGRGRDEPLLHHLLVPRKAGTVEQGGDGKSGVVSIIRLLMAHGADVHERNAVGWTPLFCAALWGNVEALEIFRDAGAEVNSLDGEGLTPLYMAVQYGRTEVVGRLLSWGAEVRHRDMDGQKVILLHYALANGHLEIAQLLLDRTGSMMDGVDVLSGRPLLGAVEKDNVDVVKFMMEAGCDIHKPDESGKTPLSAASSDKVIRCLYSGHPACKERK